MASFLLRHCPPASFDGPVDGHAGYGVLMGQLVPGKYSLPAQADNFLPLLLSQRIPLVYVVSMLCLHDAPRLFLSLMNEIVTLVLLPDVTYVLPVRCYQLCYTSFSHFR
jgi:hypothetical protein